MSLCDSDIHNVKTAQQATFKEKMKKWFHHGLPHTLHHALHHALVAAVIASCLLALENYHLLGWLDALSIRISQAVVHDNIFSPSDTDSPPEKAPVVLHIGDRMYEQFFLQKSPLDRGKLAQIIDTVVEKEPAIIVVDLDLSPGADELALSSRQQTLLDAKIDHLSHFCQKDHSRACLILALPIPTKWGILQDKQYEWMKDRCKAGVEFAMPTLFTHQAISISYPEALPNLSNVAHEELQTSGHKKERQHGHSESTFEPAGLCGTLNEYDSYIEFYGHLNRLQEISEDATQFNAHYLHWVNRTHSPVNFEIEELKVPAKADITGRAVFLGGSYGKDDKFLTTAGEMSGVFLHAAGLYSLQNPVEDTGHGLAFILDIVVGVMLGFLFVSLWCQYGLSKNKFRSTPPSEDKSAIRLLYQYLAMRVWLLINLVVVFLLVGVAYALAGYALEHSIWLNPGPLIIGMFLHGLLCSREEDEKEMGDHAYEGSGGFACTLRTLKKYPDLIWQLPLIFITVYSIVHH